MLSLYSCESWAQKNKENKFYPIIVNKEWVMTNSQYDGINFTDSILVFKRFYSKDTIQDSTGNMYIISLLKFDTNGSVKYDLLCSRSIGLCGNGLLDLKNGQWYLDEDRITWDLKGSICCSHTFHDKVEYQMFFPDSNTIRLVRKRIIEAKYEKGW
jgi:hypothetical protein